MTGDTTLVRVIAEPRQFHSPFQIDPVRGRIYAVGDAPDGALRFYALDALSGATVAQPVVHQPDAGLLTGWLGLFPLLDGGLRSVNWQRSEDGGGVEQVRDVDALTGQSSVIATLPGFDVTNGVSALDASRGWLYVFGETIGVGLRLFTIDLNTGSIVSSPLSPSWSRIFVTADGGLVGYRYRNGIEELNRIDPTNASSSLVNTLPGLDILCGAAAFDPRQDLLCTVACASQDPRPRLVCFSAQSGNIIANALLQPGDGGMVLNDAVFVPR